MWLFAQTSDPTVTDIIPATGATDVNISSPVVITFSESIDATTVDGALEVKAGPVTVSGNVVFSAQTSVLTFVPEEDLTEGTYHTVEVITQIEDMAGNPLASAFFSAFTTAGTSPDQPPPKPVVDPVPESPTTELEITVSGSAWPETTINVDGGETPASTLANEDGDFSLSVTLQENQLNTLWVTATNAYGTSAPETVEVLHDTLGPTITISSPEDGTDFPVSPIPVSGTVEDASSVENDEITVNGTQVILSNSSFFIPDFELAAGSNTIFCTATDILGNQGQASVQVSYAEETEDTTPPIVTITSPADGASVPNWCRVRGTVVDASAISELWINDLQVGMESANTFDDLASLTEGPNEILVRAVDALGLEGTDSVQVTVDGTPPQLIVYEPASPLTTSSSVITVTGWTDATESGSRVEVLSFWETFSGFADQTGDFSIEVELVENSINTLLVNSFDPAGNRSETVTLEINHDDRPFYIRDISPPAGAVDVDLTAIIQINFSRAADEASIKAPGNFEVSAGSEQVQGTITLTPGGTVATFTPYLLLPGGTEISFTISEWVTSSDGLPLISGLVSSFTTEQAPTSLSGTVLTPDLVPLANAKVSIKGTELSSTVNSLGGFIFIDDVPAGIQELVIDGSTTTVTGSYPRLVVRVNVVEGRDNILMNPIFLTPLDTTCVRTVWAAGTEIDFSNCIPGLKLTVEPASVLFPDGTVNGEITATLIDPNTLPGRLPNNSIPPLLIMFSPEETEIDPPAGISLPNFSGLTAGEEADIFAFSGGIHNYEVIGSGVVSEDELTIISSEPCLAKLGYVGYFPADMPEGGPRYLRGRVVDNGGSGIPGVTVSALAGDLTIETDEDGNYEIPLPYGELNDVKVYATISASLSGNENGNALLVYESEPVDPQEGGVTEVPDIVVDSFEIVGELRLVDAEGQKIPTWTEMSFDGNGRLVAVTEESLSGIEITVFREVTPGIFSDDPIITINPTLPPFYSTNNVRFEERIFNGPEGITPPGERSPVRIEEEELLRVIAYSPATGYVGMNEVRVERGGLMSADIVLKPPEVRIKAERVYYANNQRQRRIIPHGGAALLGDQLILIHTDWDAPAIPGTELHGRLITSAVWGGEKDLRFTVPPGESVRVLEIRGIFPDSQAVIDTVSMAGEETIEIAPERGFREERILPLTIAGPGGYISGDIRKFQFRISSDTEIQPINTFGITVEPPDEEGDCLVTGIAGAVEGGSTVTITNQNTEESVTVTAESDGSFTANIHAALGDILEIVAEDENGNVSDPIYIEVIAVPSITAIVPDLANRGEEVLIEGNYFSSQTAANEVRFQSPTLEPAIASVTFASQTMVTVIVPEEAISGLVTVVVGGETSNGFEFTVTAPVITNVDPLSGTPGDVITGLVIEGEYTHFSDTDTTIDFGSFITVDSFQVDSETQITADISISSYAPLGSEEVKVTYDDIALFYGPGFNIACEEIPVITSIENIRPYVVEINGYYFRPNLVENRVYFNDREAVVTDATTTTIDALIPPGFISGSVVVKVGNQSSLQFAYAIPTPTPTSTPTPEGYLTPTPTPTPTPTATFTPTPPPSPISTPTLTPTLTPTSTVTFTPTPTPTATPRPEYPYIVSVDIQIDNSAIINFSEDVFSDPVTQFDLTEEDLDVDLEPNGGCNLIDYSLLKIDNSHYLINLQLDGLAQGTETITISAVVDHSIYDADGNKMDDSPVKGDPPLYREAPTPPPPPPTPPPTATPTTTPTTTPTPTPRFEEVIFRNTAEVQSCIYGGLLAIDEIKRRCDFGVQSGDIEVLRNFFFDGDTPREDVIEGLINGAAAPEILDAVLSSESFRIPEGEWPHHHHTGLFYSSILAFAGGADDGVNVSDEDIAFGLGCLAHYLVDKHVNPVISEFAGGEYKKGGKKVVSFNFLTGAALRNELGNPITIGANGSLNQTRHKWLKNWFVKGLFLNVGANTFNATTELVDDLDYYITDSFSSRQAEIIQNSYNYLWRVSDLGDLSSASEIMRDYTQAVANAHEGDYYLRASDVDLLTVFPREKYFNTLYSDLLGLGEVEEVDYSQIYDLYHVEISIAVDEIIDLFVRIVPYLEDNLLSKATVRDTRLQNIDLYTGKLSLNEAPDLIGAINPVDIYAFIVNEEKEDIGDYSVLPVAMKGEEDGVYYQIKALDPIILEGDGAPKGVTFGPTGRFNWVSLESGKMAWIDTAPIEAGTDGLKEADQNLADGLPIQDSRMEILNGNGAAPLIATPDSSRLYVGNDSHVNVFDLSRREWMNSIGVGGQCRNMTITPDGSNLCMVLREGDSDSGELKVVWTALSDPQSYNPPIAHDEIKRTVPLEGKVSGVAVDPAGEHAYVTTAGKGEGTYKYYYDPLHVIDLGTPGSSGSSEINTTIWGEDGKPKQWNWIVDYQVWFTYSGLADFTMACIDSLSQPIWVKRVIINCTADWGLLEGMLGTISTPHTGGEAADSIINGTNEQAIMGIANLTVASLEGLSIPLTPGSLFIWLASASVPGMILKIDFVDPVGLYQGVDIAIPPVTYEDIDPIALHAFGKSGNIGIMELGSPHFYAATINQLGMHYIGFPYYPLRKMAASQLGDVIATYPYRGILGKYYIGYGEGEKIFEAIEKFNNDPDLKFYELPIDDVGISNVFVEGVQLDGLCQPGDIDIQPIVYIMWPPTGQTLEEEEIDYMIFSRRPIDKIDVSIDIGENVLWTQHQDRYWELAIKDMSKIVLTEPLAFDVVFKDIPKAIVTLETGVKAQPIPTPLECKVNLKAYKRDESTEVPEEDEENIGAFVALNNDDDDADGGGTIKDNDDLNGVNGEDDLIKFHFGFEGPFETLTQGKVVIERANDKIKIWKQKTKGNGQEITFTNNKKEYDLSNSAQRTDFFNEVKDKELWVEGYSSSTVLKDTWLRLNYKNPRDYIFCSDLIKITVFGCELKTYKDDDTEEVRIDKEKYPGAYVRYNDDDDDNNNIEDRLDATGDVEDGELIKARFEFENIYNSLTIGKVIIERANTKLKLWKQRGKGADQEIIFTNNKKVYDLSNTAQRTAFQDEIKDKNLWVEGYSISSIERDTELKLVYADLEDKEICEDPVKITVVDVDLIPEMDISDKDKGTKVMISTMQDNSYHSPQQTADREIKIIATTDPVIENLEIYFRTFDPDDLSPYEINPNVDDNRHINLEKGNLTVPVGFAQVSGSEQKDGNNNVIEVGVKTNAEGKAEVDLMITDQYAGENYREWIALAANPTDKDEGTDLLIAWKRIYAEYDKMYKAGSHLSIDFNADADWNADTLVVDDATIFTVNDEVLIFDADHPNGETAKIIAINGNTITLDIDLLCSYIAGYNTGDKGAAIAKPSEGVFTINFSRIGNTYGDEDNGIDGGSFVEVIDLGTGNNVPYWEELHNFGPGSWYDNLDNFPNVWFANRAQVGQNYVYIVAAKYLQMGDGTLGITLYTDNWIYIFYGEIHDQGYGNEIAAIGECVSHEFGHNIGLVPKGLHGHVDLIVHHSNHDGTGDCIMSYAETIDDANSEFCVYCIYTVRDFPDGI